MLSRPRPWDCLAWSRRVALLYVQVNVSERVLHATCLTPGFPVLGVHFTPEQEAQLAQIATKTGTEPKHLVKDAALRLLGDEIYTRRPAPELPVWHLGAIGSLHRRDIYNDVG